MGDVLLKKVKTWKYFAYIVCIGSSCYKSCLTGCNVEKSCIANREIPTTSSRDLESISGEWVPK